MKKFLQSPTDDEVQCRFAGSAGEEAECRCAAECWSSAVAMQSAYVRCEHAVEPGSVDGDGPVRSGHKPRDVLAVDADPVDLLPLDGVQGPVDLPVVTAPVSDGTERVDLRVNGSDAGPIAATATEVVVVLVADVGAVPVHLPEVAGARYAVACGEHHSVCRFRSRAAALQSGAWLVGVHGPQGAVPPVVELGEFVLVVDVMEP